MGGFGFLKVERVANRDVRVIHRLKGDQGGSHIRGGVVMSAPQQPATADECDRNGGANPATKPRVTNSISFAQKLRLATKVWLATHAAILVARMNNGAMGNTTTDVNVGLYASLVMIALTIAVGILLTSFYRRYKRANNRTNDANE